MRKAVFVASAVFELVGAVVGGALLGYFVDREIGTNFLAGVGAGLGFAVGLFLFVKIVRLSQKL